MPKRVQVAKKEELLGEDTSRIDQEEYKLQSLISPETHEANKFFNKAPSKQIGSLRVDTMSPAQVSFIQTSTQWHKYFKPSAPSSVPSNIFPDDPVLFPGMKSLKESDSESQQGYIGGGLEGLENAGLPKHHRTNYGDNWNSYGSYGSYGDANTGTDQHQKDYEDSPFTDKSWMNPKTEGRSPGQSYESFDQKSVAVPESKQEELPGASSRFDSASQSQDEEILGGGAGLENARHHSRVLEDQKANLLEKLAEFKENGVMPQEGDEKVFFGGENQKLLSQSDIATPPLMGPSEGLGTALAEEMLQKTKGKSHSVEDSTEMLQGMGEADSALSSRTNGLPDDSRLLPRPMFDERASQRTLQYDDVNGLDSDRGHLVLIRSQHAKDNPKKAFVKEKGEKTIHKEKDKGLANKEIHTKYKANVLKYGSSQKLKALKSKMIASTKSIISPHERWCKKCFTSPLKFAYRGKIHRQRKEH